MINNGKIGLLIGTFVGSLIGSATTIFVMKKLGKLEEKHNFEAQQKQLNEVYELYNNKIEELKKLKTGVNYSALKPEKTLNSDQKSASSNSGKDDKMALYKTSNPKYLMQDELAKDQTPDLSDFNIGTGVLESRSNGNQQFDYSKIIKEKYTGLQKEYEREEIEQKKYPEQITVEEFEDEIAYRKETLIYYEQNGIFAGYDDIDVTDTYDEDYFGLDNLSLFGSEQASLDGKSSRNELYLRDRLHNVDFHLIYNPTEDFNKVVNGIE